MTIEATNPDSRLVEHPVRTLLFEMGFVLDRDLA